MRKFLLFSVFTLLISLAIGCTKNEFTLDFSFPTDFSANYNVNYYASAKSGGVTVQAVASVQSGVCELKGATILPTLIYVYERRQKFPLVILAEKGSKIKITGESKNPLEWNVAGGEINEALSSWRLENKDVLIKGESEETNQAVSEFVKNNPADPVSTIILLNYFDRAIDEILYSRLFAYLRGEAKSDLWLSVCARTDQQTVEASYPARLHSLVLRGSDNEADTLRFCKNGPTLLFFWQNSTDGRKAIVDSVRTLLKETPDTLKRTIADVCLDPDSITWRGPLKKDSIDGMVRMWAPASLADRELIKLKVYSIPYYIVFDSLGYQSYRGANLEDAFKEFRHLYNRTDTTSN